MCRTGSGPILTHKRGRLLPSEGVGVTGIEVPPIVESSKGLPSKAVVSSADVLHVTGTPAATACPPSRAPVPCIVSLVYWRVGIMYGGSLASAMMINLTRLVFHTSADETTPLQWILLSYSHPWHQPRPRAGRRALLGVRVTAHASCGDTGPRVRQGGRVIDGTAGALHMYI